MPEVIDKLRAQMTAHHLCFAQKPILIGGMAMEYYGLRKAGADIDLIVTDGDYHSLAAQNPDGRKDIWGDLGVVTGPFEIWRCIMLLDYDFFAKEAIDEDIACVVSLDRLLLMRVLAMDVPKYREDLKLMKDYYFRAFHNRSFEEEAEKHVKSYQKTGGTVWGGKYEDD